MSKVFLNAGTQDASYLQTLGNAIQSELHWATVLYVIVFCLGAMTFYYLLIKSKLIPRFLSIWGLLAAILLFVGAMLGLFSLGIFSSMPLMKAMVWFAPPIALNELIVAIWLITKGFNPSKLNSK